MVSCPTYSASTLSKTLAAGLSELVVFDALGMIDEMLASADLMSDSLQGHSRWQALTSV